MNRQIVVLSLLLATPMVAPASLFAEAPASASRPATAPGITLVAPRPVTASSISATGRVIATVTAKISPRINGHIVALGTASDGNTPLDAGMLVKQGDLLFSLDQTTFKNQEAAAAAALASAQATLDNLRAPARAERLEQLQEAVAELDVRLKEKKLDEERYIRLVEEKTAPAKRLEEARTEVAATTAQLRAAQARLAELKNGATKTELAVAEASVKEEETSLKIARDDLRDTQVKAPFNGLIVRRTKSVGDFVASNPPVDVFELIAVDSLEAELRVPETYLARIVAGETKVKLHSTLLKAPLDLPITRVVAEIDAARGTFACRVAIPAGTKLVPGGFVTAEIAFEAAAGQMIVPAKALVTDAGKTYVFRAADGKLVRHEVTVVERLTENLIVTGVASGDRIALGTPEQLKDGAPVPTPPAK